MPNVSMPPMGFLATEVNIHRPPGDPFNPKTWPFPLIHELIPGSSESQIVTGEEYESDFLDRIEAAGKSLKKQGCVGIITSCGFLALAQRQLSERIGLPIATSALLQIPSIRAFLPSKQVIGVLTFDGEKLGSAHLKALGIDPGLVRIQGMPSGGHLQAVIREGIAYDTIYMEQEMVDSARRLVTRIEEEGEEIGALVLECTQMPPFAESIQRSIGIPVYDVFTLGLWFYSGLVRRKPDMWMK